MPPFPPDNVPAIDAHDATLRPPGFRTAWHCHALVTGSSGLCGARLVELLLERGASTVVCMDYQAPDAALQARFAAVQTKTGGKLIVKSGTEGDITSASALQGAFTAVPQLNVVFHIAALVGPFHDKSRYYQVNTQATKDIIEQCRQHKVPKLVYSSSPSTRFTGKDVEGLREDQLPFPATWLETYAETKAYGEQAVSQANDPPRLMTIAVAPHQIYGPYDTLFLPNLLETAGNGRLRIFGNGRSIISVCYVDNYAHGLLCGADALYVNSPALAQFYIVTDDHPVRFWNMLNSAVRAMGFTNLHSKFPYPVWFLYLFAYIAQMLGYLLGRKFKLNPFNVTMLTIHRYFDISNAKRDLHYQPLVAFDTAWPLTIDWFQQHWLPGYQARHPPQHQRWWSMFSPKPKTL
jgi:nucleoside-diphosphate-sugar epimerase